MNLYLIRHGESDHNAQEVHQDSTIGLSETGKTQASFVAERLKTIPLDLIISSPFARAKQTAEVISTTLNKEVRYSPLLVEIKRPTEIEGKLKQAPEVVAIKNLIKVNYHNPDWRHSDEETFHEFRNRALETLAYLSTLQVQNVLVVTHGEFIRMLCAVMMFGENLQPTNFLKLNHFMMLENTGITLCVYKTSWRLAVWNDVAHLG